MKHELPTLSYTLDALAPYISAETMDYHYNKHLQAYVDNLNKLIVDTEFQEMTLDEIVQSAPQGAIFNNAAQLWNHIQYFAFLAPKNEIGPSPSLLAAMVASWGGFEEFKAEFTKKALANFGSGWTWLVLHPEGYLDIINTDDAETMGINPAYKVLLACDVWEHAYYIDYRNSRAKYLENFWNVVNWTEANKRYENKKEV